MILVDDPFEGGAVAEAVVEGFGRDVGEGQGVVGAERFLVFGELHLFDAIGERHVGRFDPFERPLFELLVVEVELSELFAGFGESGEVGGDGDAGQFALQVIGVFFAVAG